MRPRRRTILTQGALVGALVAMVAAAAAESDASRPAPAAGPVIGKPVTAPGHPLSSKRFTVSFRVTRRDTGAPLLRGRLACAPSVAGRVIRHAESFRAGTARVSFVVPASAAGKLLRVSVTVASGGRSATRVATFRVLRGTPLQSLSIGDASVVEGNTGATTLSIPATLSAAEAETVTVRYATVDGTATAPADYVAASGTLTFRPGARTRTITVAIAGDREVEPTETITVVLSSPTNARIADGSATVTITDDDVRGGRYAGTTSQGLPVSFDVSNTVSIVENLSIGLDWTCVEAPVKPFWRAWTLRGYLATIDADLRFEYRWRYADAAGSGDLVLTGKLNSPGTAGGTFRMDLVMNQNVWGIPNLHCSTGDVTWTAS